MAINSAELRRRVGILDGFYKWIEHGSTFCFRKKSRNDGVGSATRSARNDATLVARILSLPPIVFIGKISYSLYLWHWIVIVFYKRYHLIHYDTPLNTADYAIMITLSFIAAIISYYAIEKPCRFNSLNLKRSAFLFYVIPALIISAAYITYKIDLKNLYGFFNVDLTARYAPVEKVRLSPSKNMCHGQTVLNKNGDECVYGDLSKSTRVLMIGDSHAGHYAPLVARAGEAYGFSVKIKSDSSCAPFLEESERLSKLGHESGCLEIMREFKNTAKDYDIIILAGYWEGYSNEYIKIDLAAVLDFLHGKKVVLMAQTPKLDTELHLQYIVRLFAGISPSIREMTNGNEKGRNEIVRKMAKGKAIWFNPIDDLSRSTKTSLPFYNGIMMYQDDHHINEFGIRQIADEVLPKQKEFWEGLVR